MANGDDKTTGSVTPAGRRQAGGRSVAHKAAALSPSSLPYYVAAFAAATAMAWYFFLFVPARLEYFVGVRLRALSVVANQVSSKAVNLTSAFKSAAGCRAARSDVERYLRLLVPEIQYHGTPSAGLPTQPAEADRRQPVPRPGLHLEARGCHDTNVTGTVPWDDLMTQAIAVSRQGFDDLVLALPNGEVVWQREETTPRIGNLAQVLYSDEPKGGWFSVSWNARNEMPKLDARELPTAVATRRVSIGGREMLLLVQPVALTSQGFGPLDAVDVPEPPDTEGASARSDRTLFVAGVIPRARLQAQAMDIPLAWVVLMALPMVVLFLALPFVKLATLTTRERFSFVDALALVLAAVALASMAAVMPFVVSPVDEDTDVALRAFTEDLARGFVRDVKDVLEIGADVSRHGSLIAAKLRECAVASSPRAATVQQGAMTTSVPARRDVKCDLWAALRSSGQRFARLRLDLDVVTWLDETGRQVDKWTTKALPTDLVSHAPFQHYRDLRDDRLWRLTSSPQLSRFTIEPVRAPTTAALGVIVAFPSTGPDNTKYFAMNLRLPSLQDVVVPPDHGFAVIGPQGEVLFHSDENRSLQENFFAELGDPELARRNARSGHVVTWSGDYHGRQHRMHVRRIDAIEGLTWRIVTFKDVTPTLASVTAHHSGTFRLVVANLALLVLVAVCILGYSNVKRRDARDLMNVAQVVAPDCLGWHVVLVSAGLLGLYLTHVPQMRQYLDWVYVLYAALPFLAIVVSIRARRRTRLSRFLPASITRALCWSELALLVILVAALPAAGFARLVDRVQRIDQGVAWLEEMQRRIADRHAQVLTRVNGPAYADLKESREALVAHGFADPHAVDRYAYMGFLTGAPAVHVQPAQRTSRGSEPGKDGSVDPQRGQGIIRFLLEWNPLPSEDAAGHPPVKSAGTSFHLDPLVAGLPGLQLNEPATALPDALQPATRYSLPPGKLILGLVLLAGTIAAAYWARWKVRVFAPPVMPAITAVVHSLRESQKSGAHELRNQAVMLIGPPQAKKDSAVSAALHEVEAILCRRIRLLGNDATPPFVEAELTALETMAEVSGGATESWQWVHVSNLETHLDDPKRRRMVLHLLDRLLEPPHRRVVIVTTTVDPIAHFEEIFEEERRGIYDNPMPEVELSDFALLFTRFRRCYIPISRANEGPDPWWDYDPVKWRTVLAWETDFAPLRQVADDVTAAFDARPPGGSGAGQSRRVGLGELSDAIASRAYAFYQLLWTTCTRHEKLVLVQLAQEGFVTSNTADAVAALMAKGLIVKRSEPTIFNRTFRTFLRRIERGEVVREWERGEGQGLWVVAGRLVASSVVAGGLFFLLTQGYSVEALLPVISGSGVFSVPLIRNLVARLSSGAAQGSAGNAA